MTEIRIIGTAKRRRTVAPSRVTLAVLIGVGFLALFAATALAAQSLARFDRHCGAEDRI